jgi:hypothetical protein
VSSQENGEETIDERCSTEEAKAIERNKTSTADTAADIERYRTLRAQWIKEGWQYNSESKKFTRTVDGQVQERGLPVKLTP